jgi:hypothetical protein
MSNNKDMKEELHKLCDSFFQSEDEEKVAKELKDNLEKFFKVIKDKYGKDFHLNDGADKFLKKFSPWHQWEGEELIQKFVDSVNNNSNGDFSWLDILDTDKQWKKPGNEDSEKEVKDKHKHVNMRYQIPTHFHGDIDNAVIFHCMENPRGYLGEYEDSYIDKELGGPDLEEYFGKTYKLLNEDNSSNKSIKEIIKERYQLGEGELDPKNITNIIYSDKSNLSRELDNLFSREEKFFEEEYNLKKNKNSNNSVLSEEYYYLAQYYAKLLKIDGKNMRKLKDKPGDENTEGRKKARKIAEKICNLEIYPFSCKDPKLGNDGIGKKILRNSDLSRLGAYIVLRRIYKYLLKCDQSKTNNEEEPQKPVFVFRKYDRAWEGLFNSIFEEAEKEENNDGFQNEQTLKNLEKLFFYCQTGQQGGGITSGNVISIKNYKIYKDIFETLKQTAFKEISDVLRRGDIDKNSSGKSGD